jgi:hypothetical protein
VVVEEQVVGVERNWILITSAQAQLTAVLGIERGQILAPQGIVARTEGIGPGPGGGVSGHLGTE